MLQEQTDNPGAGQAADAPETTDLLIIGSGISGCAAALRAAELGLSVTLLCASDDPLSSNSYWAQGGIIYKAVDDKPELLEQDIQIAGAGKSNVQAARKLAVEGPICVDHLLLQGSSTVGFDRDSDGSLLLTLEGSHSKPRIIHWRDHTGKAIMEAMVAAVRSNPRITLKPGGVAVDLLLERSAQKNRAHPPLAAEDHSDEDEVSTDGSSDGGVPGVSLDARCVGALVYHSATGHRAPVVARAGVVLATGGCGEVYAHTSNPPAARGDGLAMALRAGARVANLEFIQFHPTTLHIPGERRFLLTEALRGEGAILRSPVSKEPFARRYDPERGELAPRDVVARMIDQEMKAQGSDHVLLDISHKDPEWLKRRFPAIYKHCLAWGYDITQEPVPVVPAAHYSCGGVAADLAGQTSLPGLWAVGEAACTGLHGANRLASTSLLEGLVWGVAAVEEAAAAGGASPTSLGEGLLVGTADGHCIPLDVFLRGDGRAVRTDEDTTDDDDEDEEDHEGEEEEKEGGVAAVVDDKMEATADRLWKRVKDVMWHRVGLVRRPALLQDAAAELALIHRAAEDLFNKAPWGAAPSSALDKLIGIRNASCAALAIARAAAANPSSAGAHYVV